MGNNRTAKIVLILSVWKDGKKEKNKPLYIKVLNVKIVLFLFQNILFVFSIFITSIQKLKIWNGKK